MAEKSVRGHTQQKITNIIPRNPKWKPFSYFRFYSLVEDRWRDPVPQKVGFPPSSIKAYHPVRTGHQSGNSGNDRDEGRASVLGGGGWGRRILQDFKTSRRLSLRRRGGPSFASQPLHRPPAPPGHPFTPSPRETDVAVYESNSPDTGRRRRIHPSRAVYCWSRYAKRPGGGGGGGGFA